MHVRLEMDFVPPSLPPSLPVEVSAELGREERREGGRAGGREGGAYLRDYDSVNGGHVQTVLN